MHKNKIFDIKNTGLMRSVGIFLIVELLKTRAKSWRRSNEIGTVVVVIAISGSMAYNRHGK